MPIRYVFCINSGRSGSDYLTGLLRQATNAASMHEALPIMNGEPMQRFNDGDDSGLRELMPLKLREMQRRARGRIYCETNHSFIKGWGELIPEFLPPEDIGVIVLRRDVDRTAASLMRVHDVPGLTEWARTWYLTPGSQRDLIKLHPDPTPYERCQWYVREVEARAREYRERFPGLTWFECDLEELNTPETVRELFQTFGLREGPGLAGLIGRRMNAKQEWPKRSLEELSAPAIHPRADDLEPDERDRLVTEMLAYLQKHRPDDVADLRPDASMGATLLLDAIRLVAEAERELEDVFQVSLMFTNTESVLMHELVRMRNPRDPVFLVHTRKPPPGIFYEYDYNQLLGLGHVIRRLGVRGLFRLAWLRLRGQWRDDMSHRGET